MNIEVHRVYKKDTYTIGKLYINEQYFCNTLEDKDRGLDASMPLSQIQSIKVWGETAIPTGEYAINMNAISSKFSQKPFYMEVCQGKVPRLVNVPGYEGILLHVADGYKGAELVHGCIGVGENKIIGGLINGKTTFRELYNRMKAAYDNGEDIMIKIQ